MNLCHKASIWAVLATLGMTGALVACGGQGQTGAATPTEAEVPSPTADSVETLHTQTPTSIPLSNDGGTSVNPTPTSSQPTPTSPPRPTPTNTLFPTPALTPTSGATEGPPLLPEPTDEPAPPPEPTDEPAPPPEPTNEPAPPPEPTDEPAPPPEPTDEPPPPPEPTDEPAQPPKPTDEPAPPPEPTDEPAPPPDPTDEPAPPPEPTDEPAEPSDVRIVCILFDGEVPRSEADEYVEIANSGGAQNLAGWVLKDRDDRNQEFTFPAYSLGPGEVIRVYTNQVHSRWGGFSFGSGSSLWNNTEADVAVLNDAGGRVVSQATYNTENKPGCGR